MSLFSEHVYVFLLWYVLACMVLLLSPLRQIVMQIFKSAPKYPPPHIADAIAATHTHTPHQYIWDTRLIYFTDIFETQIWFISDIKYFIVSQVTSLSPSSVGPLILPSILCTFPNERAPPQKTSNWGIRDSIKSSKRQDWANQGGSESNIFHKEFSQSNGWSNQLLLYHW